MQTVQEDDKAPLSGDPRHRIMRLEKSITWLQDQHCNMVAALHSEIDTLKHKNKGYERLLLMEDQFTFIRASLSTDHGRVRGRSSASPGHS